MYIKPPILCDLMGLQSQEQRVKGQCHPVVIYDQNAGSWTKVFQLLFSSQIRKFCKSLMGLAVKSSCTNKFKLMENAVAFFIELA